MIKPAIYVALNYLHIQVYTVKLNSTGEINFIKKHNAHGDINCK